VSEFENFLYENMLANIDKTFPLCSWSGLESEVF